MLRFVITAGGTEENIDGVRKITNFSTGTLGWLMLETLLEKMREIGRADFSVDYIHGTHALKRELPNAIARQVRFLPVSDARSAYNKVFEVLKNSHIDVFIHSMAVSDFTFSYASPLANLAREIFEKTTAEGEPSLADIEGILRNPEAKFSEGEKIASSAEIVFGLKPTEKIISQIKRLSPKTYLVGFKLLRNADETELLRAARKLEQDNACDAILANDLSCISQERHEAVLLKRGEIIGSATSKEAIAEMVVKHCVHQLKINEI
ncbi:MAG: hypothetical protein LBS52_02040 [Dysgonamonadaceae bacterium]|jgi:phosphopantothenate-cysteine ligase|nr:hypothetical protein [Dysgonamonadaceae bacterium]